MRNQATQTAQALKRDASIIVDRRHGRPALRALQTAKKKTNRDPSQRAWLSGNDTSVYGSTVYFSFPVQYYQPILSQTMAKLHNTTIDEMPEITNAMPYPPPRSP